MFVDSHCHLQLIDYAKYDCTMKDLVANALAAKVKYLLCVATTFEDSSKLYDIAEQFENVFISIGLHPLEEILHEPTVNDYLQNAKHPRVIAIGETGLDAYRVSVENMGVQQQRFINQINAARECNKPLIVHTRHAKEQTIKILKTHKAQEVGGILHCFTEDYEMASMAIDLGFYISFSGIVTFKNASDLHEVVKKIPLEHILIETDSPYLAPVPMRGQQNQPSYVEHVAQGIAQLKDIDVQEVAKITTANFARLFKVAL
jgi:TatD DNase family protein